MNDANSKFLTFTVTLAMATICGVASPAHGQNEDMSQYPRGWYLGMQNEAATQLSHLAAAYELGESERGVLITEFDARIRDQFAYEQQMQIELAKLSDEDTYAPKDEQEFVEALAKYYDGMPMNPQRVADWVEQTLVVRGQAPNGRDRFDELCARQAAINLIKISDPERRIEIGRELRSWRGAMTTWTELVDADENGDPSGGKMRQNLRYSPQAANTSLADSTDTDSDTIQHRRTPPAPPCFAEWRRKLDVLVRPNRLDDTNKRKLESIWEDFIVRAWRRIAQNKSIYSRLVFSNSQAEFARLLDDAGIARDLDALWIEFKYRVSALDESKDE